MKIVLSFFAAGFGETIAQVLLIRELIVNFQGNEFSIGVMLANWLLLTGLGSWGLGRFAHRMGKGEQVFIITQTLFCPILLAQLLIARAMRHLIGIPPGEIVGLLPTFLSSFMVLAPNCLLNGFRFVLGCQIFATGAGVPATRVGKIYISETMGNMTGGVAFTYLLVHHGVNPETGHFRLGRFGRVRCPIIGGRKDLAMRNQRSFSVEFKRQVIQELLSEESRPAQL